jgi:D-alanyl-lipoteichoic acid acyltransferase DltB (MBOAT superfamily)
LIFNSIDFAIFIFVVLVLCALLPQARLLILLAASFVFYSWISWLFGLVLFAMSACAYVYPAALPLFRSAWAKATATSGCIVAILLPLFFLKYWNFSADAAQQTAIAFGLAVSLAHISYPLPPGISFHSFQLLAYVVDVYKGRSAPEQRPVVFFLFSSFFPQLVAGPIERPNHLIPQLPAAGILRRKNAAAAFELFLYGLFLKVAIADVIGIKVDEIYAGALTQGSKLLIGTALFYVQIYCDFAGYSLMAIGVARALGVRLVQNFNAPVLAASPHEFWHRWHISLSQWFRDYVYIPLGGDRRGLPRWVIAIAVTFVVSGLWHGANWTFVIWGAVHGAALIVSVLIARAWPSRWKRVPFVIATWIGTQLFVVLTWVFFRSKTTEQAMQILDAIGRDFLITGQGWREMLSLPDILAVPGFVVLLGIPVIAWITLTDTWIYSNQDALPLSRFGWWGSVVQKCVMLGAIGFASLSSPPQSARPFIYFQF